MNEHQLKSDAYSLVLHRLKAKRDADYIRDAVVRMAKAYADARVAETIEGWKITREHLQNQVSAKDTEIAELKAEIKRLRDGVKKEVTILRMLPMQNRTECIADMLLSPTPVAETQNEVSRETMMKALLDIEGDAHAKMVLGTPLNTKSILMSARHGLGIDSEMIHPQNEDQ